MTEQTADIAAHYCGQTQPHNAHIWRTPPVYGTLTYVSTYQCAGLSETDSSARGMMSLSFGPDREATR